MSTEKEQQFRQEVTHKLNLILDAQMAIIRALTNVSHVKDEQLAKTTHRLTNEVFKIRIEKGEL